MLTLHHYLLYPSYLLDFGEIGEGFPVPCKQVYACQHFLDYGGEAKQNGQVCNVFSKLCLFLITFKLMCQRQIKRYVPNMQGLLLLEFNSKKKLGDQLKTSEQFKILGDL